MGVTGHVTKPALLAAGFLSVLMVAVLGLGIALATGAVVNGGFESGDFDGWQVFDISNSPTDTWYVYDGNRTPLTDTKISKPSEGVFAATTDVRNPGAHILYQDITLDRDLTHILSFTLYYDNSANTFHTPETLDPSNPDPLNPNLNQQYRIDIMRPHVPVTSMRPAHILANVFRTEAGDSLKIKPTNFSFDLTPFAGSTVRLRFAEVDNQGPLVASVDDVRIGDSVPKKGKKAN